MTYSLFIMDYLIPLIPIIFKPYFLNLYNVSVPTAFIYLFIYTVSYYQNPIHISPLFKRLLPTSLL